jgi:hypothetical protein
MDAKTFAMKAGVKPNAVSAVYFIQAGLDGPIKIGAKAALDALGVSTGAAQVRLEELWALVDEEEASELEVVVA